MPRFFFDVREGDSFTTDDEGLEFPDIERAQCEASRALADMAKDAIREGDLPEISIEVRDSSALLLRTTLRLEVQRLR
jgi:hypothetical protein